jgi:hypothetical protein
LPCRRCAGGVRLRVAWALTTNLGAWSHQWVLPLGGVRVIVARGGPLVLRCRDQGGIDAQLCGQGVVLMAVVLVSRFPGWRRGGLSVVVAVRHSVSAIGPQLPWAGSVGRPRRLVWRSGYGGGQYRKEKHSPGGGRGWGGAVGVVLCWVGAATLLCAVCIALFCVYLWYGFSAGVPAARSLARPWIRIFVCSWLPLAYSVLW